MAKAVVTDAAKVAAKVVVVVVDAMKPPGAKDRAQPAAAAVAAAHVAVRVRAMSATAKSGR